MKNRIKQLIKGKLTDRQQKIYYRLLEQKTVSYDEWIKAEEKEAEENKPDTGFFSVFSVKRIPFEACEAYITGNAIKEETAAAVLFSDADGEIGSFAEKRIGECFAVHETMDLVYGDEDVISPDGTRHTPWLKPDWSPDTFLSFFYFGSIFAVRTEALRRLSEEQKAWIWKDRENGIYRMCFLLAKNSGGFEKRKEEDIFSFPIGHVDEILFHARTNREMELHGKKNVLQDCRMAAEEPDGGGKISVIILSKDHPEILKRCIRSVQEDSVQEEKLSHEIIVVDNGSREEVKQELTGWLAENKVKYIYEKMPFHFSGMCRLGAENAAGNVLLFMNDDVEVIRKEKDKTEFLKRIYQEARKPYTGAVGVKLYYPGSNRIQHAGIVNLDLGPVHKLQFKEDNMSCNYGWNRKKRNVIAVTGACLAVEREKFAEAGGFPEELPVAFNDVDLCFSLFEKGYYNVVLQDVACYHYESLSRGNDDEPDKLSRLLREREKLYERHPALYAQDPFYHKYFASDILSTGFELKADYGWAGDRTKEKRKAGAVTENGRILDKAREDACVIISLEYAGHEKGGFLIQGYSFITGSDNACYEKSIILGRENDIFTVMPEQVPRRDVEDNLPDQVNVGLAGFRVYLNPEDLPDGTYRVGILAKDKCTGAKLYAWTNRYLTCEKENSCGNEKGIGNDRL